MSKSGGGKEQGGRPTSVPSPKSAGRVLKVPTIGKGGNISPNSSKRGKDQKVGS
jgi:hypothetical protein